MSRMRTHPPLARHLPHDESDRLVGAGVGGVWSAAAVRDHHSLPALRLPDDARRRDGPSAARATQVGRVTTASVSVESTGVGHPTPSGERATSPLDSANRLMTLGVVTNTEVNVTKREPMKVAVLPQPDRQRVHDDLGQGARAHAVMLRQGEGAVN
jgi:Fe2+ transport system protein FeoA